MDNSCSCDPEMIVWEYDNIQFDEHQCFIPGTCGKCGEDREYVYTESGIRTPTGQYLQEL